MRSNNKLKKIHIKNHACYYFGFIMRVIDINSRDILLYEKKTKMLKLSWVQYHCVLGSMK